MNKEAGYRSSKGSSVRVHRRAELLDLVVGFFGLRQLICRQLLQRLLKSLLQGCNLPRMLIEYEPHAADHTDREGDT